MINNLVSQIIKFVKTLPGWQKILAKVALDLDCNINQNTPVIETAFKRFMYENQLSEINVEEDIIGEINETPKVQSDANADYAPRLHAIRNCQHVNALVSDQEITFSPNLTIIYGENGTGKSGYVRLFNNVFYSRGDKKILHNVLLPKSEEANPHCVFDFQINGTIKTLEYPTHKNSTEFKHFACFDSKTVDVHLQGSNELYVIPQEMKFFERMVQLIRFVLEKLRSEVSVKDKLNHPIASLLEGESNIKTSVINLNYQSNPDVLTKISGDMQSIESQLRQVEKEYNELVTLNPSNALNELRQIQKQLEEISNEFNSLFLTYYTTDFIAHVKGVITEFINAKLKNKQKGIESFKNEFLKTVGSDLWKKFIVSMKDLAREESEITEREFPKIGDHCPLCLQYLNDDAIKLFNKYFDFLKSETEEKLKVTEENLNDLISEVSNLKMPSLLTKPKLHEWLQSNYSKCKENIEEAAKLLISYQRDLHQSLINCDIDKMPTLKIIQKDFVILRTKKQDSESTDFQNNIDKDVFKFIDLPTLVNLLDVECDKYDEKTYKETLKEKSHFLIELKHRKVVISHLDALKAYIAELKWLSRAKNELSKTYTKTITDQSTRIFGNHLNKRYKQIFYKEVQELGVGFGINIKSKGSYGKTSRKLETFNYPPGDVLSEGQQKVLALADFLTEVELCNINGGIIFDDPVNSLDHERKLYIAKRLAKESKKRQVIIFTHDLSFLCDLQNEAEMQDFGEERIYYHWITNADAKVGYIHLKHKKDLEGDYKKPNRAHDYLKRAQLESDVKKKEELCKTGFGCLRTTYEAFILFQLFGGTVVRFNRRINYGKFKDVYCPNCYIKEVSGKLEYLSKFIDSHLSADFDTTQIATPQLLEQEILYFEGLTNRFNAEKNSNKNK